MSGRDGADRRAAAASLGAAVVALAAGVVLGHGADGLGVAAGLVIGSFNPPMIVRSLGWRVSFQLSSIARIVTMTAVALGVGAILGGGVTLALVAAGVALAQAILAGVALREMLRA